MRVAVIGASGYTGLELLRILLRHPEFEISVATSEQRAGIRVGEAFPALSGLIDLEFESNDPASIAKRVDLAFTALPHAASAPTVQALRAAGVRVLDLSADFRLRDVETYRAWYGEHKAAELRGPLKKRGLLTRDARKKERKKYGQKGARARFQFSKR